MRKAPLLPFLVHMAGSSYDGFMDEINSNENEEFISTQQPTSGDADDTPDIDAVLAAIDAKQEQIEKQRREREEARRTKVQAVLADVAQALHRCEEYEEALEEAKKVYKNAVNTATKTKITKGQLANGKLYRRRYLS